VVPAPNLLSLYIYRPHDPGNNRSFSSYVFFGWLLVHESLVERAARSDMHMHLRLLARDVPLSSLEPSQDVSFCQPRSRPFELVA